MGRILRIAAVQQFLNFVSFSSPFFFLLLLQKDAAKLLLRTWSAFQLISNCETFRMCLNNIDGSSTCL